MNSLALSVITLLACKGGPQPGDTQDTSPVTDSQDTCPEISKEDWKAEFGPNACSYWVTCPDVNPDYDLCLQDVEETSSWSDPNQCLDLCAVQACRDFLATNEVCEDISDSLVCSSSNWFIDC